MAWLEVLLLHELINQLFRSIDSTHTQLHYPHSYRAGTQTLAQPKGTYKNKETYLVVAGHTVRVLESVVDQNGNEFGHASHCAHDGE